MENKVLQQAQDLESKVIQYRRKLHQNPELGLSEHQTSKFIAAKLKELGLEVKEKVGSKEDIEKELEAVGEEMTDEQGPTGVVGILEGEKVGEGKTVLLRSDMDALLISESKDDDHTPAKEGFRSENEGVMHACGHDAHIAMLLGAAEVLAGMKEEFAGRVKFLFQPDEERGCGAKVMRSAGVLEDVDAVFGIHVWSPLKSGEVMINKGPMMASVDNIWLDFKGGGGHSSEPHGTSDPLLAANDLINALYKMNAREIDTRDPSLVTVEAIHSEADWGVIPSEASMKGTIRTFDPEIRRRIIEKVNRIGNSIAARYELEFEFDNLYAFPPTINTEQEAEVARKVAKPLFGEEGVVTGKPVMSGEDFSYYLEEVPGAFIFLGIGNEDKGTDTPHHNPKFDVDEDLLYKGVALNATIALEYLK